MISGVSKAQASDVLERRNNLAILFDEDTVLYSTHQQPITTTTPQDNQPKVLGACNQKSSAHESPHGIQRYAHRRLG
jgi:hypothetical protein